MSLVQTSRYNPADRRVLVHAFILIALGLSLLFLNSWDNLFVRTSVGLFWATFLLILNWSDLVQLVRGIRQKHDAKRSSNHSS